MNNTIIQKPFVKMLLSSNLFRANLITSVHKALGNINQSTVDEDEIRKHTLMSKDWWNVNGSMKALHSLNNIRVPFVRDGLVYYPENKRPIRPLEGKSILDVGCGGGILSEPLARLGASVMGIDASQELIDLATDHSQKNAKLTTKPSYICTTIEEHSCDNKECYDGVVASEIIEHVNNKELFIKSCLDTLKPGGRIFFTTPNRTRLTQVFGICVAEYVMKLVPKGTHDYEKLTTPTELTFLLERIVDEKLRYLAVRPNASLLHIRQKLWYLLDLPDYCEEILTLKTEHNEEIPLTYFRKGNDPQHPFILEVWPPEKADTPSRLQMLTLGDKRSLNSECKTITLENGKGEPQKNSELSQDYLSNKSTRYDTLSYKKSDLSCRMSTSTLFFKIHGKKSRDNFAHLLLKIQSDLTTLSSKLSNLEQRIPV